MRSTLREDPLNQNEVYNFYYHYSNERIQVEFFEEDFMIKGNRKTFKIENSSIDRIYRVILSDKIYFIFILNKQLLFSNDFTCIIPLFIFNSKKTNLEKKILSSMKNLNVQGNIFSNFDCTYKGKKGTLSFIDDKICIFIGLNVLIFGFTTLSVTVREITEKELLISFQFNSSEDDIVFSGFAIKYFSIFQQIFKLTPNVSYDIKETTKDNILGKKEYLEKIEKLLSTEITVKKTKNRNPSLNWKPHHNEIKKHIQDQIDVEKVRSLKSEKSILDYVTELRNGFNTSSLFFRNLRDQKIDSNHLGFKYVFRKLFNKVLKEENKNKKRKAEKGEICAPANVKKKRKIVKSNRKRKRKDQDDNIEIDDDQSNKEVHKKKRKRRKKWKSSQFPKNQVDNNEYYCLDCKKSKNIRACKTCSRDCWRWCSTCSKYMSKSHNKH